MALALHYCETLEEILAGIGIDDGSISLQDHWAILHEMRGDIELAIRHREREVELLRMLFGLGGPVGNIDYRHLAMRLMKLAGLYDQIGQHAASAMYREQAEDLSHKYGFILS